MSIEDTCSFSIQASRKRRLKGAVVYPSGARVSAIVSSASALVFDMFLRCVEFESTWSGAKTFGGGTMNLFGGVVPTNDARTQTPDSKEATQRHESV